MFSCGRFQNGLRSNIWYFILINVVYDDLVAFDQILFFNLQYSLVESVSQIFYTIPQAPTSEDCVVPLPSLQSWYPSLLTPDFNWGILTPKEQGTRKYFEFSHQPFLY